MYTKESFCNLVLRSNYDKAIINVQEKPYKEFSIPKKNGIRKITYLEGNTELAILQNNLIDNFLEKQHLPICVKGFKKGENYNSFLNAHIGSKFFMRVDIKDFFPSLKCDFIKEELSNVINFDTDENREAVLNLISEIVTFNNSLPQGAFSSPAISNIVMARIDQRILKYCQELDVKYTRYADDLLFSSYVLNFKEKTWFLRKVKYILSSIGLKINYSKLKFSDTEIGLNGYIISKDEVRLSRKRLHDIRSITAYVNRNYALVQSNQEDVFLIGINGLPLNRLKEFNTVFSVVQYLNGYRSFLISMLNNQNRSSTFQKNLRKLLKKIEEGVIKIT